MLPTMKIGDLEITRLVVGSNPFTGKSHLDEATDNDMKSYFSDEQAFAMLRRCEEAGINAIQSRGSMPVMGLLTATASRAEAFCGWLRPARIF